jgi:Flp pilus assembly protein TadG
MAFAGMTKSIKRHLNNFRRDSRGNLTMIAGLSAIPVIAAAGMAIDYARISRVHDEMQQIADGATLAAVSARNLSGTTTQQNSQQVAIATNYMTNGLAKLTDVDVIGTPTVTAANSKVKVSVKATVKGSFMNVLNALDSDAEIGSGSGGDSAGSGGKSYGVSVTSEASKTEGASLLCMLVLNPSSGKSLEIQGTADIIAPTCTVWVNSTANDGIYLNGTATMDAKKICMGGNYNTVGTSTFLPDKPKNCVYDAKATNPYAYPDPLAAQFATDYPLAYAAAKASGPISCVKSGGKCRYDGYNSSSKKFTQLTLSGSGTTVLYPGIYDGGIQVKAGHKVQLRPGTYFIQNGKFEVQQGTVENYDDGDSSTDDGVTIVLTEPTVTSKNSSSQVRLDVTAQSNFNLKAPASGYFEGIVVAQHPNSVPNGSSKSTANSVIGGGSKNFVGIIYYPSQIFYISGSGSSTTSSPDQVATGSPQFAIVADKVYVEGNSPLRIGGSSDSTAAGLPSLPTAGAGTTIISLK